VGAQLDTVQYRSVALLLMYGEFCAVLILILCCCCWYRTHAEKAIDIITSILPDDHLLLASSKRVKGLSRACATVKQIQNALRFDDVTMLLLQVDVPVKVKYTECFNKKHPIYFHLYLLGK